MVKNKQKREVTVPVWLIDGFVGILALVIYNFALYVLGTILGVGGFISSMEEAMGNFCINSFVYFGLTPSQIAVGLILTFVTAFLIGILIGHFVRKRGR